MSPGGGLGCAAGVLRAQAGGPGMNHMDGSGHSPSKLVAKSLLHVGDVDTARTRVYVVEPLVGNMRVTRTLKSLAARQPRELRLEFSGVEQT